MKTFRSYLLLCIFLSFNIFAFSNTKDTSDKSCYNHNADCVNLIPIRLPIIINNTLEGAICNNSTFYMHVKNTNSKIVLNQVQGLLDGTSVAVGELINTSGSREGFIIRFDNEGNFLSQNILRINNIPVSIQDFKINLQGALTIGGLMQTGNTVFVAQLSNTFSSNWVETIDLTSAPVKLTLHLLEQEQYALAVQTQLSVQCFQLNSDGSIQWNKEIISSGLVKLLGFANMVAGGNGVVTLNFRNGRNETEVTSFSYGGNIISTHIIGNGIEENKGLGISSFALRMTMLCIKNNGSGGFKIVRNRLYNSSSIETHHEYQVAGSYDFNTTGAIANAGDAMGICTPQNGKLLFIKQFADYHTSVEFSKQYDVPPGSIISALARVYDGGFLFGLNRSDSSEFILLKTDSSGIVSGCGYQDVPITSTEKLNLSNTVSSPTYNTGSFNTVSGISTLATSSLNNNFDCRQNYCPPPPLADTCQSTYFKTLVSAGYNHSLYSECLMRDNNLFFGFSRVDNLLEDISNTRGGFKLYDEGGHFIKGIYLEEMVSPNSTYSRIKQISDSTILYCTVTYLNADIFITFRVFSDNLDLVSQHSFKAPPGFNIYSGGFGIGDIDKDEEGNFYLCGTSYGVLGIDPRITVCKVTANGSPVWVKTYSIHNTGGWIGNISMVTTSSSVICVAEGESPWGSMSVRIDKTSGQMLNAFKYANFGGSSLYNRLLTINQGHIFYAGQNGSSNFVMGLFDTLAKPTRFKYINEGSIYRSGCVKNGKLYSSFLNKNNNADIMLKADTALNVSFITRYDNFNYSTSMVVDDAGNIYSTGVYVHGRSNNYYDPFFRKYDADAHLGLCPGVAFIPTITDINLNTAAINYSEIVMGPLTIVTPLAVNLTPDNYGHGISSIVCSTPPTCNMIDISGPSSVCQLNVDYTYHYTHNPGCNLLPECIVSSNILQVQNITDTTIVVRFTGTGTVWLKAVLNSGCSKFMDSIEVQVQNGGSLTLGHDTLICQKDTLILNAGKGFNTYNWQDGSAGQTFTVTHGGQYYVTVSNICGEILADTINVMEGIIPPLTIGNDTTVCQADTIMITASPGFATYNWQPAPLVIGSEQQVQIQPLHNEEIMLYATTSDGCYANDTMKIFINEVTPVQLGNDSSFCDKDSLILNAGIGYSNYLWNNGSITNSIVVKQPGTYSVLATDINGCIARDTLIVNNVFSLPAVSLGPDVNLCFDEEKTLDAGNFSTYLWQDNTTTRYYTVQTLGKYYVTVKDQHQCSGSDSMEVKNIFPLPADFLTGPDSICSYEKVDLKPVAGFHDFLWSTGNVQEVQTVTTPGIYTLSVTDNNGCRGKDTIQIFQKNCFWGVYIPTAFTPNADGKNDVFRAMVFGTVLYFKLEVYDRYGNLIFISDNPATGWDGKRHGLEQNVGTYVWKCYYQLVGKQPAFEKGTVLLLH